MNRLIKTQVNFAINNFFTTGFIDCLTNYVRQEMRQYHVSHKLTIHHASESDFVLNGASRFMANKPDKNFLVHCLSSNMETLEGLVVEDPCSFFF